MSYLFFWDPVHRLKAKTSNLNILWKEAGDSSGKVHGICSLLYTPQQSLHAFCVTPEMPVQLPK